MNNLSFRLLRFGLQWFENLPILYKLITVLLTLDIFIFIVFTGFEVSIERDEAGNILRDQVKAELATIENIYRSNVERSQSVCQANANNIAIINIAQQYNNSGEIDPELQERVYQILADIEVHSPIIKTTFLVSRQDLKIIASKEPQLIGKVFNPNSLVSSVLSNSQQITVNQMMRGEEIQNIFENFSSLSPSQTILVQYTFTPVKTWESQEVVGVLVYVKLVTGKDSILDRSMFTIGGGYHAIYLQKPDGKLILASSLLDTESHIFGQHHDHNPQNHLSNVPLPDTRILTEVITAENQTITQRMAIEGSQYTVAAKIINNTQDKTTTILVRGTPEIELFGLLNSSIKRHILLFLLVTLLSIAILIFLMQIITRPLKILQQTTQEFSKGNFKVRAKEGANDEIGQLTILFNRMADEIAAVFDQEVTNTQTQLRLNQELNQQIEEREKIEKQLNISLREKETLLKEIHHRVKNNLFVVSNLLDFQADYFDDERLTQALEDSRNRIYSMAIIHQQLYRSTNLHEINFSSYLEELIENLVDSYNSGTNQVKFHLKLEPIFLNVETANPCGLIVNELISNVFKHAFPDGRLSQQVWLGLHQKSSGEIILSMKDNGVGFPEGVDFRQVNSLGMELINTLTQQLEGKIEMKRRKGTLFTLRFYELKYGDRIPT